MQEYQIREQWPYQKERQRDQIKEWWRTHPDYNRLHMQEYRAAHPEETRAQRLKDWKRFSERHPERWKEIHNKANRGSRARLKAEREALAQKDMR